jgi:hypothetical protein
MDKLNSSDGVGSSTRSSITTSMSSNYQELESYKPEFLKYLENRTKPNHSPETGEQLKPEDDILYQWRLRRKMEEAQKTDLIMTNDQSSNSQNITQVTLGTISSMTASKPKEASEKIVTETHLVSEETFKKTKITIKESEKQTTETQTSISVEGIGHANLCKPQNKNKTNNNRLQIRSITTDTNDLSLEDWENSNTHEIEITIENEEPTKDNSDYLDTALIKKYKKTSRSKNVFI